MSQTVGFYFLSQAHSRRILRIAMLFVYFLLFQSLILLQKPFLQLDFIIVFYLSFAALFAHHTFSLFKSDARESLNNSFVSYLADFLILIFFMRYFAYLSSFILVLQLFLLFVSSFDLDILELCGLGFVSSLGASLINLSLHQSGSIQSVLSLALFNLSYVAVILISRQLKSEFVEMETDLSQTRKRFRSKEEFAKTVLENIPLGLAVFHKNEDLVLQNPFLQKMQITQSELKSILFLNNEPKSRFSLTDDIVYKNNNQERKVLNIDQSSYFDTEINDDLNVYMIRDVTELRELENQQKQNEKMAAVGQLAAGIAHEIRNPLAGISGSIQLLTQDTQDETQKKLMNIILKEIDRLNNLITEFLDYAKPEKLPDQVMNVKNTIDEVLLICRQHKDAADNVDWKLQIEDGMVLGFHEKLKQAFLNIVINGLQAMKGREKLVYQISVKSDAQFVEIKFTDSGCGMTEATKQKMFEPFHTTKPKGTGLGLAITHKILELHKAQISIQTEVGVGTEFTIKLPAFKGDRK